MDDKMTQKKCKAGQCNNCAITNEISHIGRIAADHFKQYDKKK